MIDVQKITRGKLSTYVCLNNCLNVPFLRLELYFVDTYTILFFLKPIHGSTGSFLGAHACINKCAGLSSASACAIGRGGGVCKHSCSTTTSIRRAVQEQQCFAQVELGVCIPMPDSTCSSISYNMLGKRLSIYSYYNTKRVPTTKKCCR